MIPSPITTIKQIPLHATASSNITIRTPTVNTKPHNCICLDAFFPPLIFYFDPSNHLLSNHSTLFISFVAS
jgi:hypothetical protein